MWASHLLVRTCVSMLEHQSCHLPEGSWDTSVPIHAFKSRTSFSLTGSVCLCSMKSRMSCCVRFQTETQGRLGTAFPEVNSAIPACVSLAVGLGGHLITVTLSQGKALAREGREGRKSFPHGISVHIGIFELSFCPCDVVTRALLLKGEFKCFYRGEREFAFCCL